MKLRFGAVLICFVALMSACESETGDNSRIAAIESDLSPLLITHGQPAPRIPLEDRMKQLSVPAVSVALIVDGELKWAKAYGFADIEDDLPATPDTLFQVASLSKPVAALGALKLVEEGRLDLDQNVNDVLTSWRLPDNEFTEDQKVTLRNLLNHSAGTTVWGFPGYPEGTEIPSTAEVLDGTGNTDAVSVWREPGESWQYSGGGYTVMEQVLSDISGEPFPQLMDTIVLSPLEMHSSTFEQPLPGTWRARAASGYNEDGNRIDGRWHSYPERAAAGLWSTPTDFARYIIEVQRAHSGVGRILSAETAGIMLQAGMNSHGLGPVIEGDGDRLVHGGANNGYRATFTGFIDSRSGAVVMTNSDNGGLLAQELIYTIAREYEWPGVSPQEVEVVDLQPAEYEKLVGQYEVEQPSLTVEVAYEEDQLVARFNDGNPIELLPETPLEFFSRDGMTLSFQVEGGDVSAIEFGGGSVRANKVDEQ